MHVISVTCVSSFLLKCHYIFVVNETRLAVKYHVRQNKSGRVLENITVKGQPSDVFHSSMGVSMQQMPPVILLLWYPGTGVTKKFPLANMKSRLVITTQVSYRHET